GGGAFGIVRGLTVFNGNLIAGGEFTSADSTHVEHIARWTDVAGAWRSLESGANDVVSALIPYRGDLIAAGRFNSIGGAQASRIAGWDGFTWQQLGGGTNADVLACNV